MARVGWSVLLGFVVAGTAGCPGSSTGCARNSDCAAGSYCSAGACVTECTPATVADDCEPGRLCNSFGMCVGDAVDAGPMTDAGAAPDTGPPALDSGAPDDSGGLDDSGASDAGPRAPDAPDAPDIRPACVIAGGTDGDGDGYCAAAATEADCDDANSAVSPGAAEVCTPSTASFGGRAVDENCDGAIDEGCGWYFGTPHPVLVMDADADQWDFESPRLSEDGLRLYVRGGLAGTPYAMLVLTRTSPAMPFGPPALVPGLTGLSAATVSADELEAYVQAPGTGGLQDIFRAARVATSAAFGVPVPVTGLNDTAHDYHPFLASEGLELFFGSARTPGGIYRATRTSPSATTWSAPGLLSFGGSPASGASNSPALSEDGLTLFFGDVGAAGYTLYMARRASRDTAAFGTPVELSTLWAAGMYTLFPYVSERTAEIFFLSDRAWSPSRGKALWRARICRDGPCPAEVIPCSGGTRSPDGHHCYVARTAPLFQAAAAADCAAMSAHLATLHSAAENTLVFGLLSDNAWIGARQRTGGTDYDYEWETGEPWIFTSWATAPVVQPGTLPAEDWGGYWIGASETARWGDYPQQAYGSGLPFVCETEEWPTW